jgi:hypothetical protein
MKVLVGLGQKEVSVSVIGLSFPLTLRNFAGLVSDATGHVTLTDASFVAGKNYAAVVTGADGLVRAAAFPVVV